MTASKANEVLTSFVALGCRHSGYADACTANGAFEDGRASVRMEQPVLLGLLNDCKKPFCQCLLTIVERTDLLRNATLSLGEPPGFRYSALPCVSRWPSQQNSI